MKLLALRSEEIEVSTAFADFVDRVCASAALDSVTLPRLLDQCTHADYQFLAEVFYLRDTYGPSLRLFNSKMTQRLADPA